MKNEFGLLVVDNFGTEQARINRNDPEHSIKLPFRWLHDDIPVQFLVRSTEQSQFEVLSTRPQRRFPSLEVYDTETRDTLRFFGETRCHDHIGSRIGAEARNLSHLIQFAHNGGFLVLDAAGVETELTASFYSIPGDSKFQLPDKAQLWRQLAS
jgi:hypothetical protein